MRDWEQEGQVGGLETARSLQDLIATLNEVGWWLGSSNRQLFGYLDEDLSRLTHKLHAVSCLYLAAHSDDEDERLRAVYRICEMGNPETLETALVVVEGVVEDHRCTPRLRGAAQEALVYMRRRLEALVNG